MEPPARGGRARLRPGARSRRSSACGEIGMSQTQLRYWSPLSTKNAVPSLSGGVSK